MNTTCALEERLAKLETRNRLQAWALYGVATCLLVGLFTGNTEAAPTTLKASRFELVDASGKTVGVWEAGKDANKLAVLRPDGSAAVKIVASPNVAGVMLSDKDGDMRATALVDHDLPSFALLSKDLDIVGSLGMTATGPKVDLKDANGKIRARMGVIKDESYFSLMDPSEKETWSQKAR